MEQFAKSFGPGKFTCGAKWICFLPAGVEGFGNEDYIKIAEAPEIGSNEWYKFADLLTTELNRLHSD